MWVLDNQTNILYYWCWYPHFKKGENMAVRKRKDTGMYEVRIRKYGYNYSKSFRNKKLAEQDERRIITEIETGTFRRNDITITIKELCDMYMNNHVLVNCRKSTQLNYQGYIKNYIYPFIGNLQVRNFKKLDGDNFISLCSNKKCINVQRRKTYTTKKISNKVLTGKTVNNIRTFLKSIFEYAVDSDIISKNPMEKVKKVKEIRKEQSFLTTEECKYFIDYVKIHYPEYYEITLTSIITGARQGELCALTWDDVDFVNGTININKTYSGRTLGIPKTYASIRKFKIPKSLILVLKKHKLATPSSKFNLVFPNKFGRYQDSTNLRERFLYRALKSAGLKQVCWHSLRSSCITTMAELCIPTKYIQYQAGHSNPNTTLKYYTHVTTEMENQAITVMDNIFGTK